MTLESEKLLDDTGWRLIQALQENARLSYTELGQRVGLSSPAVADRVRRMEEAGIIRGYHAEVNLPRVGLPVQAIIRIANIGVRRWQDTNCQNIVVEVGTIPEVLECYRVTGDDSIIVNVVATSVEHLADVIDHLSQYGVPSTSLVRANPMKRHQILQETVERHSREG